MLGGRRARAVVGFLPALLVLSCGTAQHGSTSVAGAGRGGTGGAGGATSAGGAAGGDSAGTGVAGGASTTVDPGCLKPLNEWMALSGTLVDGVGNMSYVSGGLLYDLEGGGGVELMTLDEQHPEQPGAKAPIANLTGVTAAAQGLDAIYAVAPTGGTTALHRISGGAITSSVTTSFDGIPHDGVLAFRQGRVVLTGRRPNATVRIEAYDPSLAPLPGFTAIELPMHAASSVATFPSGIRVATLDNTSKTLQILELTDSGSKLVRSHSVAELTIMIAWAGDSVVLRFVDKLVLIASDDSRTDLAFPVQGGDPTSVANLHAAETPFGIAVSLSIGNLAYIGLVRDGAIEWGGPYGMPQAVFADLRWDERSIGVYAITTTGGRQIVYAGLRCPG